MKASLIIGVVSSGLVLGLISCSTPSFQTEPPVQRGPASEGVVPSGPVSTPPSAPTDTLSLATSLQPYVKKLNTLVFTYHYVSRESVKVPPTGALDVSDPKIANHVQDWANYYWDLSQPGGTGMIRGLYLATDPVASREFGKDHWLLYRVALRAGMTYLDMTGLESAAEYIPQPLQDQLQAAGCKEQKWSYVMYKSFDPACRAIALKTLQDLDVTLIDYSWVSADFPPCTHRPSDAFILLKPERLDKDAVQILYAEMPNDDLTITTRQRTLEKFFSEARPSSAQSGSTSPETNPDKYRLWPDMDETSVTDTDFRLYLREHIYGCAKLSSMNASQ